MMTRLNSQVDSVFGDVVRGVCGGVAVGGFMFFVWVLMGWFYVQAYGVHECDEYAQLVVRVMGQFGVELPSGVISQGSLEESAAVPGWCGDGGQVEAGDFEKRKQGSALQERSVVSPGFDSMSLDQPIHR